jgi:hypothetical protein
VREFALRAIHDLPEEYIHADTRTALTGLGGKMKMFAANPEFPAMVYDGFGWSAVEYMTATEVKARTHSGGWLSFVREV